jgi:ATP-dependent exoDNAse (exonuclease V) beta subunit
LRVTFDHEVPTPDKVKRQRHPSLAKSLEEVAVRVARGEAKPYDQAAVVGFDPRWITRLSVTRLSGQLAATPDVDTDDSPVLPWSEEPRSAGYSALDPIALGNLVHAVMERVDLASPTMVSEWCRIFAPQYDLIHADQLASEADRLLTRFLAGPRAESMRGGRWIEREVEFNLAWPLDETAPGGRYLQGYIDCLYEDEQGTLGIVDYKTNQTTPEGVSQVAHGYELQMLVYALAVEQSLGRGPDEMVLCFLRPGVEYAFAWNEGARQRAIALVDQAMNAFFKQPASGRAVALPPTL